MWFWYLRNLQDSVNRRLNASANSAEDEQGEPSTKSETPLPSDAESQQGQVDNKMFFWPIWTKSEAPLPSDAESQQMQADNKMFFWPIWTKSEAPLPSDAE